MLKSKQKKRLDRAKARAVRRVQRWLAQAGQYEWYLLTALRGPDDDNSLLKSLTTSRIRGLLMSQSAKVGAEITPLPLAQQLLLPDEQRRQALPHLEDQLTRAQLHFRSHMLWAIQLLADVDKAGLLEPPPPTPEFR